MRSKRCLCSCICLKISVHSGAAYSCVLSVVPHPPRFLSPTVKGCVEWVDTPKGFWHSSKCLLLKRRTPGAVRWGACPPSTWDYDWASFEQNRWKVSVLKWSAGDESRIWNKRWKQVSQREATAFKKFPAPVYLDAWSYTLRVLFEADGVVCVAWTFPARDLRDEKDFILLSRD